MSTTVQTQPLDTASIQRILNKTIDGKRVFGASLCVTQGSRTWVGSAGNLSVNHPYFIASTTKLFTTAIILQLAHEQRMGLDDPIQKYLPPDVINGLHVYQGTDFSAQITVRHLLSQTSGLPDYFEGKGSNGKSLIQELTTGHDQHWTFEDAIARSKQMKPHFPPGQKNKAHYTDTNYQLLGKIIEILTDSTYDEAVQQRILEPLGLRETYVFRNEARTQVMPLHYKSSPLHIPQAMASFGPDGGIVSTSEEMVVFIRAFFGGQLFPAAILPTLYQWNSVMFPLEYGVGLMRFRLPRIFSPFRAQPTLLGHSGLSGAFAYYCPEKDVFLTGTVNQIHPPSISYQLMLKVLGKI